MERIIATRPDNTTYELAKRGSAMGFTQAVQKWDLQGADIVSVTVESAVPVTYGIGDKITVFGRDYKLNRLPKVTKSANFHFIYELEFEGIQYDLLRATYDLTVDTTSNQLQDVQADSLTGDLQRFATVLIANANRVFPGKWSLGTCPETISDKTLTFGESDNCLSVLQNLCSEFNVEFSIEIENGINVISFSDGDGETFPYTFKFGRGRGLYHLERLNVDTSSIITRLKVYGSTENIAYTYRANRLCLPDKSKSQSYIENASAIAQYGIWEAVKYFDDIKPTFDGEVTAIDNSDVLKFTDTSMFDLNAEDEEGNTLYLIAGQTAKIHFNSGNLAGYEFDVHSYNHATHTFVLKQFEDERGDLFPSETSSAFQIAVGDKYKILGVALPQSYIDEAEEKLEEDGLEYFNQNRQPKVKYALSIDKNFFEALAGESQSTQIIKPGDWLHIIDSDIDVDKSIRIVSLTRQLFDEYNYTLEVSDTVANATIINNIISDIIDINNVIQINNLNNPARARANWRSSREVLDMVFDPEGDYYTEKIKPNSIDTLCLAVGAKSMQFGLIGVTLKPNYNGDANSIQVTAGTLVHYTIDENAARTWNVAATSVTFSNSNAAYYIYAKCAKNGTGCTIIFTTTQEQVDGGLFYYFFIGIVNSVDSDLNARSVSLMYGFTMINGRFIQTGRICSSGGGATYFDLDAGEIGGKITLLSGSSGYNNLADIPDLSHFLSDTDGIIEIWYKSVAPTTSNAPASSWNTTALKNEHIGDLYRYVRDIPVVEEGEEGREVSEGEGEGEGRASARWYRWEAHNTIQRVDGYEVNVIVYRWVEVTPVPEWFNNIVPSALPSTSQKMFSFITPTPPYSVGDIWLNGGVFMKCLTARTASDSFVMSDWDDSGIYDNTQTIIDGGMVTSGTIQLAGNSGNIKAGITGKGTADTSVRIWAGDTFDNRANAPFRVLQNGKVIATNAEIEGKIKATDGVFYGSLATPAQTIPDNSSNLTLSFANGFNFSGKLTNATSKNIILPNDIQYAGVELSIVNYGGTNDGYYNITDTSVNGFLYSSRKGSYEVANHIHLYGYGILRAKAYSINGTLRWFVENYMDFSYNAISQLFTNNLPSQYLKCVGIYTLQVSSLTTVLCSDGNTLSASHTDTGKWTLTWSRNRSNNKKYMVLSSGGGEATTIVYDVFLSSFKVKCFARWYFGDQSGVTFIDYANLMLYVFEIDV